MRNNNIDNNNKQDWSIITIISFVIMIYLSYIICQNSKNELTLGVCSSIKGVRDNILYSIISIVTSICDIVDSIFDIIEKMSRIISKLLRDTWQFVKIHMIEIYNECIRNYYFRVIAKFIGTYISHLVTFVSNIGEYIYNICEYICDMISQFPELVRKLYYKFFDILELCFVSCLYVVLCCLRWIFCMMDCVVLYINLASKYILPTTIYIGIPILLIIVPHYVLF